MVGTMSPCKLSAFVVILLVTVLSVLVYLQSGMHVARSIATDSFRPRKSHLLTTGIPKETDHFLHNDTKTREMSEVAYRAATATSNAGPTEDFMASHSRELERRRQLVLRECKRHGYAYGTMSSQEIAGQVRGNLLVDDEHKAVYCAVPKIACTSWKKVFLVLNRSFKSTAEISQYYANRAGMEKLVKLRDLPPSKVEVVLSTYTKFMFTRHPFSRVLSAFRNKLAPDTTFERADRWQQSFGVRILNKYRSGGGGGSQSRSKKYDLKFEEFVKYLADESVPYGQSSNKHWSRVYDQCHPCDIRYDVIGKFESLQEDSRYILRLIHAEDVAFPGANSSSPTGSSNQTRLETYYKNVPLVDLQGLYQRFKIDFDFFNYDAPTLAFRGS